MLQDYEQNTLCQIGIYEILDNALRSARQSFVELRLVHRHLPAFLRDRAQCRRQLRALMEETPRELQQTKGKLMEAIAEVAKWREQATSSANRLRQLEQDLRQSQEEQATSNEELMSVKEQLGRALAERDALLAHTTERAPLTSASQAAQ